MKTNTTDFAQLVVWTDVDPAHEEEFNQWYDQEHMEERVAIEGFEWARRYRNISESERRYLAIYRTENLDVFGTPAYAKAFQHQTDWSNTNFARMSNTKRRVMRVPSEGGFGSGATAALVTLDKLDLTELDRSAISQTIVDSGIKGLLGFHLMTPDEKLSTPLPSENPEGRTLESAILVDATDIVAAKAAGEALLETFNLSADRISLFRFIWELRSDDLEKNTAANAE
ncbi:MAG: hypothetical protein ABJE00_06045 [Erythrobacter sp.]